MIRRIGLVLALTTAVPALAAPEPMAAAGPRMLPNAYQSRAFSPSGVTAPPAVDPARAGSLDLAYGAYQRGLYLTAYREATARLDRDPEDAAAMTLLGELYNQGLAVRQDTAQAAEWYRLAARHGDAHAMASLGLMAADGRGLARDPVKARDWLEKAASRGEPTACYNLALLLLASGSDADIARAATLLKAAAEAEIGDAQHDLGVLYARGKGVPADAQKAAELYLRSARNGSIAGEVEYGIALFNGEGVPRNEAAAARLFRRAAAQGNAIAQNRLARLYVTGRGVPRNLVEAAAWHLVAAGQGLADGWLDSSLRDLPKQDRTRAEQLAADRAGQL